MSKATDEYEDIARRLKELEADRQLALTGSTVPEPTEAPKDIYWPGMCGVYMTPGAFNDAARQYLAYKQGAAVALVEWKTDPNGAWYAKWAGQ